MLRRKISILGTAIWSPIKKSVVVIWSWLNKNGTAIQSLAVLIAIATFWLSIRSVIEEQRKFNLDYGSPIRLIYSGSTLQVNSVDPVISNIDMRVDIYLQLSEKKYEIHNPIYIEVKNLLQHPFTGGKVWLRIFSELEMPRNKYVPVSSQISNLDYVFNETPKKLYPSLLCLITIDYSDANNNYKKEYYVSHDCINEPIKMTEEQINRYLERTRVIGSIDYAKTNRYGFASGYFVNRMSSLLSKHVWKTHWRESSLIRDYRLKWTWINWEHNQAIEHGLIDPQE